MKKELVKGVKISLSDEEYKVLDKAWEVLSDIAEAVEENLDIDNYKSFGIHTPQCATRYVFDLATLNHASNLIWRLRDYIEFTGNHEAVIEEVE